MYNISIKYVTNYYLNKNNTVSIVIGIKFKDGVILVSDSQATDKVAGMKALETVKIFEGSKNNIRFIYSGAENPILNKMIFDEIIGCYTENISFKTQCEEAYNKIRGRYPQKVIDYNLPIRLLIGINTNNNTELYHLEPDGFAVPIMQIESIGCRHDWAKITYTDMLKSIEPINNYKDILAIALVVIDKIKKYDLYCGGKSQYKILHNDGNIENTDENFVKKIEDKITEKYKLFSSKWW